MGFTLNIFANTYAQLTVLKTKFPSHALLTEGRILNLFFLLGCYNSNKIKNVYYIMTHSVAPFDT